MKSYTEEEIISYIKKRNGYVTDNDLHLEFIPKEAEAYLRFHDEINSLIRNGMLKQTSTGYELKDDK